MSWGRLSGEYLINFYEGLSTLKTDTLKAVSLFNKALKQKNNITEQEEGLGKLEYERSKNKRNGPQGGYGSGRLVNLNYNNEISK